MTSASTAASLTAPAAVHPLTPPPTANRLALAGLAPFALGTALVWLVDPRAHPYAAFALASYAALVASFVGALHWSVGMQQPALGGAPFVRAVVPCVVAWPASLMPPYAGLVVLGALLGGTYLLDRRCYPAYGLAGWLTLRFRLSVASSFLCFLGAAGA